MIETFSFEVLMCLTMSLQVYKCTNRSTGGTYAMKVRHGVSYAPEKLHLAMCIGQVVRKTTLVDAKKREHMQREIAITKMLKHPYIVTVCKRLVCCNILRLD